MVVKPESRTPTESRRKQASGRARQRAGKLYRREAIEGMAMALPWILGFVLFTAGPMLASVYLGLTRWDIITSPVFVSTQNYVTLAKDPLFLKSLGVTVSYTLWSAPIHIILGFVLASLLNAGVPGTNIFRAIYYLPSILPLVASAVLWSWILNPEFGLLNFALAHLGIQGPGWLTSEQWALPAMVIMNIQFIGITMVIMLAGLQRVPQELYEAAQLDGANGWQRLRFITLPMMSSVIFFAIIININNSFQTFTQAYVLTNGGPSNATLFYMLYLYNQAFRNFRMGYASALAMVLFLIMVTLTAIQFRMSRLWVYTEEG
ncbi:MAG TPA: sugar ABC transporter permease [Roseiflexaceae bacterium]|jgi:multiple sugar transport system permease protein|nr:sugar ABC transporter permease [Roseiflexaceae bacterium]